MQQQQQRERRCLPPGPSGHLSEDGSERVALAGPCFIPARRSQAGSGTKAGRRRALWLEVSRRPDPEAPRGPGDPSDLGISVNGNTASENEITTIDQKGKKVSLVCKEGNNETRWLKDGMNLTHQGKELVLAVMDDPRGIYVCSNSNKKSRPLQVFIRMCQNCIHLDFTTILGISAASLITTVFLAIAVYHIAVEERGRPAQASDKQCLLANDQLYQPLQERNDRPYSHIGIAKPRRR